EHLERVPHEIVPRAPVAAGDERLLARAVVDQEEVDVAVARELEGGAGAHRDHVDARARRLGVRGEQDGEETAVLHARRRPEPDGSRLPVTRGEREDRGSEDEKPPHERRSERTTSTPRPSRRRTTVSNIDAGSECGWSVV